MSLCKIKCPKVELAGTQKLSQLLVKRRCLRFHPLISLTKVSQVHRKVSSGTGQTLSGAPYIGVFLRIRIERTIYSKSYLITDNFPAIFHSFIHSFPFIPSGTLIEGAPGGRFGEAGLNAFWMHLSDGFAYFENGWPRGRQILLLDNMAGVWGAFESQVILFTINWAHALAVLSSSFCVSVS